MNFALQTAILVALLLVCCFVPGFFIVRKLRLNPMEKLCASFGLSIILLYIDTWIVFIVSGAGKPLPAAPFLISSAVCVLAGIVAAKDIFRFVRSFRVRQSLTGFKFLFVWTLAMLGMIRVYSGGHWSGDWQEHFQRTLFFLQKLPADTTFAGVYPLHARPPLMNVVTTFFLAQTQDRYELFQIVFTFLNLLVFLACCLILPAIAGPRRVRILPLVVLFALNPVVMQNATYAWTRALTAFFVVSAVAFYLSAWRKGDTLRMVAAFVLLAAGMLVHYSAGPYVAFLTLHYLLWLFWRRADKWKELAFIIATCGVLLATWLGWSAAVYGRAAFTSTSTIIETQQYEGSNASKVAANLLDSVIPATVRSRSLLSNMEQPNTTGWIRDLAFLTYQPNIILGMGLIGGPVVWWLMYRRLRQKSQRRRDERIFWTTFIVSSVVLGALVVGTREPLGLAHGTFLSLEVIGLTLLATRTQWRTKLTVLILAGCVIDFSFGILLHAHVQSFENTAGKTYFSNLEFTNGRIQHADPGPDTLSSVAWQNWFEKHRWSLCTRWLEDLPNQHKKDPIFQAVWPVSEAEISKLKSDDEQQWGGWYSRHGGELTSFGDHVVERWGEKIPASILVALAAGLIVTSATRLRTPPQERERKPTRKVKASARR